MQVESIDNYAKSYIVMENLLPNSSRAMDGVQSGHLVDAHASASQAIGRLPALMLTNAAITAARFDSGNIQK